MRRQLCQRLLALLCLFSLAACATTAPSGRQNQSGAQNQDSLAATAPPASAADPDSPDSGNPDSDTAAPRPSAPAPSDAARPLPAADAPPAEAPPPLAEVYVPEPSAPERTPERTPESAPDAPAEMTAKSLLGANLVAALPNWTGSDTVPALAAFQRSCQRWAGAAPEAMLGGALPEYGRYADWAAPCAAALKTPLDYAASKDFFERAFTPVTLTPRNNESGLMTGYYQPEILVKRRADPYYNEPILAVPQSKSVQNLPRAELSARAARVIAYGRPLDVFFMQIQGSGHLRYEDGPIIRAAYAGNNGHPYRSIGRVLIERGEITKDRSSKRDIENWMTENGPEKSRALMNENPRYIYFKEQKITEGEGPNGAMGVPLTAMGSMAVDPRYHPYGSLIWLGVRLPQNKGDYIGQPSGLLLSAQDTGKAIRGALRGDLYFGSGAAAGDLAGVMKHRAVWTALLPKALAARLDARQNNVS